MAEPYEKPPASFAQGFQLVGEFMWQWANLEQVVNQSLCLLLDLGELEGAIVESNMQWRDKIHCLRTCVRTWGFGSSEEWVENADKFLVRLGNMSKLRNTVAHNQFMPMKAGGVRYYITSAKGELKWPETRWTKKQFEAHFQAIHETADQLQYIVEAVTSNRQRRLTPDEVKALYLAALAS